MKTMNEEYQQYRFWSLDDTVQFKPPQNPTHEDLQKIQQDLEVMITEQEGKQQHAPYEAWTNFFVNFADEPEHIGNLREHRNTTINIPLPMKSVLLDDNITSVEVVNTTYMAVRMLDARVFLLPQAAVPPGEEPQPG